MQSNISIPFDESLFGDLWPFIQNDDVTDIRWNGRQLWIENLKSGRYLTDIKLSDEFLNIFTQKIAVAQNVNFNRSTDSLQASTDILRIHCIHPDHTGDHTYSLSIRKVPAVARITNQTIKETAYADEFFIQLLGALVRSRCKGIVIGDVGAGKTELLKYVASFVPANMSMMTIEDTLEMKLPVIYPDKDITSVLVMKKGYTTENAIRDALRLETKYLWNAEARGREIKTLMETASTGCCCWSTIHTSDVWLIPDRIVQMAGAGEDQESLENDVYTFFDVGIKVKKETTENGVHRRIDQICFFDRTDKVNHTTIFYRNGQYTGKNLPKALITKLSEAGELEVLRIAKERFYHPKAKRNDHPGVKQIPVDEKIDFSIPEEKVKNETEKTYDPNPKKYDTLNIRQKQIDKIHIRKNNG